MTNETRITARMEMRARLADWYAHKLEEACSHCRLGIARTWPDESRTWRYAFHVTPEREGVAGPYFVDKGGYYCNAREQDFLERYDSLPQPAQEEAGDD